MKLDLRAFFLFLTVLTAVPQVAFAQAGAAALNDTQLLGRRLFTQSCGVCHSKPVITSGQYGPVLSKESLGGQSDVMVEVISNGTPRMPGFKYTYSPEQIAAIASYLLTVAAAPASAAATPAK
jgi:mono/diheme cytochrome c family protein